MLSVNDRISDLRMRNVHFCQQLMIGVPRFPSHLMKFDEGSLSPRTDRPIVASLGHMCSVRDAGSVSERRPE